MIIGNIPDKSTSMPESAQLVDFVNMENHSHRLRSLHQNLILLFSKMFLELLLKKVGLRNVNSFIMVV